MKRKTAGIEGPTPRNPKDITLPVSLAAITAALNAVPMAVSVTDSLGRVLWSNTAFSSLAGFSPSAVISQSGPDTDSNPGAGSFDLALLKSLATGKAWVGETDRRDSEGKTYLERETITPVIDSGEITYLVFIKEPVGSSNRYRDDLAASEAQYRRLFEAAKDGILILDPATGTIVDVNPFLTELLGLSRDKFLGKRVWEMGFFKDLKANEAYFAKLKREKYVRYDDMPLESADGRVIEVEFVSNVYLVNHKRTIQCNVRDITKRKIKEHRVEAQHRSLEKQVRMRTSQLNAAKDEAERANLAKSEFLSHMSHELRTPLNSVLGFAQLIDMRFDDPRIKESTAAIIRAGHHLLQLINEVLELSRIESGMVEVTLEETSLSEIWGQATDLLRPIAEASSVTVSFSSSCPEKMMVVGDAQKLAQVIINLLNNAIKYNHFGGKVVGHLSEPTKGTCRLSITDTGYGISKTDRGFLFQPFQRFGDQQVEGTGLGLALSKRFVDLMGGTIGLLTSTKDGSVFHVDLKIAESVAPRRAVPAKTRQPDSSPSLPGGLILYIEDNLSNMRVLEIAFNDWTDYRLLPAAHGMLGLELAREHHPDLILLDLHLPDLSGEEVLKRLKANPATSAIPVIILSADATAKQATLLKATGVFEYLTKPIDLKELLGAVDRALAVEPLISKGRLSLH